VGPEVLLRTTGNEKKNGVAIVTLDQAQVVCGRVILAPPGTAYKRIPTLFSAREQGFTRPTNQEKKK
jgi:hypothetical protein